MRAFAKKSENFQIWKFAEEYVSEKKNAFYLSEKHFLKSWRGSKYVGGSRPSYFIIILIFFTVFSTKMNGRFCALPKRKRL